MSRMVKGSALHRILYGAEIDTGSGIVLNVDFSVKVLTVHLGGTMKERQRYRDWCRRNCVQSFPVPCNGTGKDNAQLVFTFEGTDADYVRVGLIDGGNGINPIVEDVYMTITGAKIPRSGSGQGAEKLKSSPPKVKPRRDNVPRTQYGGTGRHDCMDADTRICS